MSMRVKKRLFKFIDITSKDESFYETLTLEDAVTEHIESLYAQGFACAEISYKMEEVT